MIQPVTRCLLSSGLVSWQLAALPTGATPKKTQGNLMDKLEKEFEWTLERSKLDLYVAVHMVSGRLVLEQLKALGMMLIDQARRTISQ